MGRHGHVGSLATSTALSSYYIPNFIPPHDVFRVLNDAGVRFVLVGTHALGGWMNKPRTTHDVDVLVAARGHNKAVRALEKAFPDLTAVDIDSAIQLQHSLTEAVLIDVLRPKYCLLREVFEQTHIVRAEDLEYAIPSLEMALALKFNSLISPTRDQADWFQDAHDFMRMVGANAEIDLRQLAIFGNLIYNGCGAEIVEAVRKVRAGEKLSL